MKDKKLMRRWLLLPAAVAYNALVYTAGRVIANEKPHLNFTTAMDERIPFVPWTILIYWGCVLFWAANYYLCAKYDKGRDGRFLLAHFIGETACFLCFAFLPTTMERADIIGNGFFENIVRLTYHFDKADNLLPSIHCFVSWLCWIGVRGNKNIPKWYQWESLLLAVAVCASTLMVKQHIIWDVAAGILLAEFSYLLAARAESCPATDSVGATPYG